MVLANLLGAFRQRQSEFRGRAMMRAVCATSRPRLGLGEVFGRLFRSWTKLCGQLGKPPPAQGLRTANHDQEEWPTQGRISVRKRGTITLWSKHYAQVCDKPAKGERWFCRERELSPLACVPTPDERRSLPPRAKRGASPSCAASRQRDILARPDA